MDLPKDLEAAIERSAQLEKKLSLAKRIYTFLYYLGCEKKWISESMSKWRYKAVGPRDISFRIINGLPSAAYIFNHNGNNYRAKFEYDQERKSESHGEHAVKITVERGKRVVFHSVCFPKSLQDWKIGSLEAFVPTDEWYEHLLEKADLVQEENHRLQKEMEGRSRRIEEKQRLRELEEKQREFDEIRKKFIE